jgi:tetrapyrrole methylase family protein/MazG family protein
MPGSAPPRIVVVGLGPAGPELLTAEALAAIERAPLRFLRTTRHPAASAVPDASSFDHLYEEAADFAEVYRRIAEELEAAATEHGEVLYAVPGSPRLLERSVALLLADRRVEVEIVIGLSFADLAWDRLGVDPVEAGVRLVDGHVFARAAAGQTGPLLVAHCHSRAVLSDIKLALEEPPPTPVTVLQRLGCPDEAVFEVAWGELDRSFEPDHLTALWIPDLAAPVAAEIVAFEELVRTLRTRCPWDREQTHTSLTRHLLEETYEVLDALAELAEAQRAADPAARVEPADGLGGRAADEKGGLANLAAAYEHLQEELGDLLYQIAFHARLAAEEGQFTLADVARGIHDKLVRRHPHVFGDAPSDDPAALALSWEEQKRVEKNRASVLDGIVTTLPALALAAKVVGRAAPVLDRNEPGWRPDLAAAADAAREPSGRGTGGSGVQHGESERDERARAIGELLLAAAAQSAAAGIDPEAALRAAALRLAERARNAESREP